VVVIAVGTVTAGAATEGTTVAIIRAEAGAMIVADGVAVKAGDLGLITVPDKAAAARTVTVAEIVAIGPRRIIRPMPRFATVGATLLKIRMVAIVTGTRAKTKIVTRTATRIKTRIAIRTATRIKTRIVTGTAIRIRTKTGIVVAIGTMPVIGDTTATPFTTTRLLTTPGTTKTILMAKAPTIEAMKTACLPEPAMVAADSPTIPSVRTSSGVDLLGTARSLAAETSISGPIAMVSCEATRKAIRIGKGISAVGFSTANSFPDVVGNFESRCERNPAKHIRNRARLKKRECEHLASCA
jgi:hypothetical protein